ncbi:hypothetical protein RT99_19890 [Flavobacterium sp. MEB061]|nr:hypothetical protein RT99_19890 [Flavobacterium sp. MEB061]
MKVVCHFDPEASGEKSSQVTLQSDMKALYKSSGGTIHFVATDFNPLKEKIKIKNLLNLQNLREKIFTHIVYVFKK